MLFLNFEIILFCILKIEYAGRLYDIEIVDTAGQEEFSSFRDSSLASGDAFLILFAINSQASWNEMKDLRSKIIEDKEVPCIPMVVIGNKRVSSNFLHLNESMNERKNR